MKKKVLLWLDDYRDPFSKEIDWMVFSPIGRDVEIVWAKNYKEFVRYIRKNGLPDGICFDHDLGVVEGKEDKEKTGYDCAKWLINYCFDFDLPAPPYNCQSANPVGKVSIKSVFEFYARYREFNRSGTTPYIYGL